MATNIKGKVYETWNAADGSFSGYSVAVVTYKFSAVDGDLDLEFGKERKTLQAAINDGKSFFKKRGGGYRIEISAHADLYKFYDDGTQYGDMREEICFLGLIDDNGEYFKMYNNAEWL